MALRPIQRNRRIGERAMVAARRQRRLFFVFMFWQMQQVRRMLWIHPINEMRTEKGEFYMLYPDLWHFLPSFSTCIGCQYLNLMHYLRRWHQTREEMDHYAWTFISWTEINHHSQVILKNFILSYCWLQEPSDHSTFQSMFAEKNAIEIRVRFRQSTLSTENNLLSYKI